MEFLENRSTEKKFSSLYLVEQINIFRNQEGNRTELRHSDLLRSIEDEFDEEINQRNISPVQYKDKKGEMRKCYQLTSTQSIQILARESKFVRKAMALLIEKRNDDKSQKVPTNFKEALLLAVAQQEIIEQQSEQLALQAPKIEVFERLADRKQDVSTTILAKSLNTSAIKLNLFLKEKGIKWKNQDLPSAGYMDWFNVVSDVKNGHEFSQTLVTPLGQIEIAKLYQ